jgi:hypothetical protein
MSKPTKQHPSEIISSFLNYIDECKTNYQNSLLAVNEADKKELLDLVHDMEFAKDKQERGRIATRLHNSRIDRRRNKDTVDELEEIVKFFDEINHKTTLNKLKQILGKQRKTEEYLSSERVYKPRKKGDTVNG